MKKIYIIVFLLISTKIFAQTYPAAFDLSSGNYSFSSWPANSASGSYPPNMIFHFVNDPAGGSFNSLANGNGNYDCSYNLTSRNRVNGQGANGFSFIATSSALWNNCASGTAATTRFAGAALLGLNSTGVTSINVSWTGRTISAGDGSPARFFSVKLQYRIGTSGNWTDVPGAGIYNSSAAGNSAPETAVLPAACENHSDLFLRWIYYQNAGSDGSRPEIAIDDITVGTPPPVNNLSFGFSSSTTAALNPPFITGTLNDAADPAAVSGFFTDVKENGVDILSSNYSIGVSSNNNAVVAPANVSITKNNGIANIKIIPAGRGYADLTFTLTKGSFTKTLTVSYAASQSASSNAKWMTGIADASAAIALDDQYMIIANDESNLLYVYDRNASGLPVKTYDFNQGNLLTLTDGSAGNYKEVDIEAGVKSIANAGRIYWLGSMSNSSSFNDKPNRNRLFAVNATGTGSSTSFTDAGHYNNLRARLIIWGDNNGYNFSASAAAGQDPKLIDGFNAEGMVFAPDNSTIYIGFRAPLVPTANRTKAVIAPIRNFETWFNNGAPAGNPVIDAPIELDLGGKGIRDLIRLSTGVYIIVAGNYDNTPVTGMIYKWTGNPADAPIALPAFNINSLNAEAAIEIFEGGISSASKLQLIEDNGSTDFYGDGSEAKDLTQSNFKKFSSEVFQALGVLPVQFEYVYAGWQGNNAVINWGMQHSEQVQSYSIEYSVGGSSFTIVGTKPAVDFINDYSYRLVFDKNSTGYYRIRANLKNGTGILSPVKYIGRDEIATVSVYPNPVTGDHFVLATKYTGYTKAAIFNEEGKLVKRFDFGAGSATVSTGGMAKGHYIIKIISADQSVVTVPLIIL